MDVGLVCDACSTFNPMGTPTCSRCGVGLSLDGDAAARRGARAATRARASETSRRTGRHCPGCGARLLMGQPACPGCGLSFAPPSRSSAGEPRANQPASSDRDPSPSPAGKATPAAKQTMFFGAMQAARAKLVLIRGDGLDGVSYALAGEEHLAGRENAALRFEEDPFLSPIHANFFYRNGKLVVRDEGSVNGIYTRIRGRHRLSTGDRFLVGEQLLEIEERDDRDLLRPSKDGTYFFASPQPPGKFRVVQQLRGGATGLAYVVKEDRVSLGREGNDINFPDDPFISGHHAQVSAHNGTLQLSDLNSKNGTFVRVNGEAQLSHGDYLFLGQQLLRVEIV